ncbi:MAG TPA: hypothetical protein VGV09_17045 [Steroidobacteraceae bacterium]|nr:hypothetical protein [Steroidobacteraceae bacterium]
MSACSARLLRALSCACLLLICVNVFAKNVTGPVVVLPNSFYLQPDKGGQTKLVKHDGSRLVSGTIAAYAVVGQYVIGAEGTTPAPSHEITNDLDFAGTADTRYFILDTVSGKLESGLTEAAWRQRIKDLGQRNDVHIYPPLPWQN